MQRLLSHDFLILAKLRFQLLDALYLIDFHAGKFALSPIESRLTNPMRAANLSHGFALFLLF